MDTAFAFILEGATEKVFYIELLQHICRKHGASLNGPTISDGETIYTITAQGRNAVVKLHAVNAISQVPKAGLWFQSQCLKRYPRSVKWHVFLCYDQDDYKPDVTRFFKGDWSALRAELKKANVIDMAACADIEDVLLQDCDGICHFLRCSPPTKLTGGKGKVKMKNLFRSAGKVYHEGERARDLIEALDMQKIIDSGILPLEKLEKTILITIY
jgi:hypothetical protein